MMITANAKRYASALFDLAQEKNLIDPVHQDFQKFSKLVEESAELRVFLSQPLDRERENLLIGLLKARFTELFFNFMLLVLKNKRFHLIEQILDDFERQVDLLNNRISAVAVTAVPLSREKIAALTRDIAGYLNAEVRVENEVDPSIIGGLILRLDDKVFNASLAEQFKKLKLHLIQNQK